MNDYKKHNPYKAYYQAPCEIGESLHTRIKVLFFSSMPEESQKFPAIIKKNSSLVDLSVNTKNMF